MVLKNIRSFFMLLVGSQLNFSPRYSIKGEARADRYKWSYYNFITDINGRKYHGFHWGFLFHPEIKVELWAPHLMSLVFGPFFLIAFFWGGDFGQTAPRWTVDFAALLSSRFGLALEFLMDDFKEVTWFRRNPWNTIHQTDPQLVGLVGGSHGAIGGI